MTTLADLRTRLAAELRDPTNATWNTTELDYLINQGIDAVAAFYPKEIVQTVGTVSAGVNSYAVSSFSSIYRLDIYTSAGSYRTEVPHAIGGANTGWEMHGGVLYLPPSRTYTVGDTLRAWGYGGYIQLSASTSTTDLDVSAINAVLVFAEVAAYSRLTADRAQFQQWQANTNGVDTTALGLAQLQSGARATWRDERSRLRRMRKSG